MASSDVFIVGTSDWKEAVETVCIANQLIWNTKLKEAEELLVNKLKEREQKGKGEDLISLLISISYAEVSSWRTNLSDSPETHEIALNRFAFVEERAQNHYDRLSPSNGVVSFFNNFFSSSEDTTSEEVKIARKKAYFVAVVTLAEASVMQGNLNFKRQNFVRGAYFVRRGWKFFEEARTLESELHSANHLDLDKLHLAVPSSKLSFAVGMFNYAVSMIPPMFRWIVEMIGFEADRERAMKELKKTVDLQSLRSNWARMALTGIRWFFLEEKEEALKELEALLTDFPTSAILWNFSATFQRRDGALEVSTLHFHNALKFAEELPQLQLTLEYELAHNYFLQLDFESATPLIQKYLRESTGVNYKAYGTYKLGFCYWMTGKKGEEEGKVISSLYSDIEKWVRPTIAWDAYAARKGKEFLQQGTFTKLFEYLFCASNLLEGRLFERVHEYLDKADSLISRSRVEEGKKEEEEEEEETKALPSRDDIAWCSYLRGVTHKEQGHPVEALEHLMRASVQSENLSNETWIRAYSDIELSELYLKGREFVKSRECLQRAEKYSKYDFAKQAHMKITKLKTQLQKATEGK